MVRLLCLTALGVALAAALSSLAAARTPTQVTWHKKCVSKAHFCASFPYAIGSDYGFIYQVFDLPKGTSASGKEPNWSSNVYRNPKTGRFCTKLISANCKQQEFYSVSVFKSKFSDPWQALTAINGGVKDPVKTNFDGNLAARFKDLYGYIGYTVWHRGMVYYIKAGIFEGKNKPLFAARFFSSIKLT